MGWNVRWPWLPCQWGRWRRLLHSNSKRIRSEAWGYVFWLPLIFLLFLPAELLPVAWSSVMKWPTFSATVGHLEYRWGWPVPLIVVGVMVFTGVNAYARNQRQVTERARQQRGTTRGIYRDEVYSGRIVRLGPTPGSRPDSTFSRPWLYILVGIVVTIAATWVVWHLFGHWWGSYVLWGLVAIFVIVLPSVLAWRYAKHVPFPTLFRTAANLQNRYQMIGTLLLVFIVGLGVHLTLYPWPNIARLLKTSSTENPTIAGNAVARGTVTISGAADNCLRPEGIVIRSKAFTHDVTATVKDGHYSVPAKLRTKSPKGETVTVFCGRPEVGETTFK